MNLKTAKNFFIEAYEKGTGKKAFDLWEILRWGGRCKCFAVDCCKGFIKVPTMDGSAKVYLSIIGDEPVYMTKEEMEAKCIELNGAEDAPTAPCTGGC